MDKQLVMVLGVTGKLGSLVAKQLRTDNSTKLRVTTRRPEQIGSLKSEYGDAVLLDLDDPRTFPAALQGVDRLFLLTGYTVDMLVQAKCLTDATIEAGVKHIVQLGVFTPQRACSDPHFAWHQLIQSYIRESGIPWTFLHPNVFMQNLLEPPTAQPGQINWWGKDCNFGWVALEDVAEAAAKILKDGPAVHNGKDYWFSTESLNIEAAAKIIGDVIKFPLQTPSLGPDDMAQGMKMLGITDIYFTKGAVEFFRQVLDGRIANVGDVRDDFPKLIGRTGTTLKDWAELHKEDLVTKYKQPVGSKV
jgi:NAD(P)H dehydrogenase (quinone)